jgi:hypothetical protein
LLLELRLLEGFGRGIVVSLELQFGAVRLLG